MTLQQLKGDVKEYSHRVALLERENETLLNKVSTQTRMKSGSGGRAGAAAAAAAAAAKNPRPKTM